MKPNKTVDRIERALWNTGCSPELFIGGASWAEGVMASIHSIGPLALNEPGGLDEPVRAWPWATAIAACLAIGIGLYVFNDLNTDTVLAGMLMDDPAGWTVNMLLSEM